MVLRCCCRCRCCFLEGLLLLLCTRLLLAVHTGLLLKARLSSARAARPSTTIPTPACCTEPATLARTARRRRREAGTVRCRMRWLVHCAYREGLMAVWLGLLASTRETLSSEEMLCQNRDCPPALPAGTAGGRCRCSVAVHGSGSRVHTPPASQHERLALLVAGGSAAAAAGCSLAGCAELQRHDSCRAGRQQHARHWLCRPGG